MRDSTSILRESPASHSSTSLYELMCIQLGIPIDLHHALAGPGAANRPEGSTESANMLEWRGFERGFFFSPRERDDC